MKKFWVILFFIPFALWSQEDVLVDLSRTGKEIGLDGYFSAGTNGGNLSLGVKFALLPSGDSTFAFGPSFRLMRAWSKLQTTNNIYDIYGAGVFLHVRLFGYLFIGGELEFLNSPLFGLNTGTNKHWITTLFLGGGYSQSFLDNKFRLNVGLFYDVVNNLNSPYRASYPAKKVGPNNIPGPLIPVLYRLSLFIPLGKI